ncbi:coiled-coil domain-containing protein 169 [Cynoglossus semilaevis]|uniref:coiled-coil domain-containing protein 169 n=1 Tax=Cynoglossus semilaevis TaxID=244447 RepID=UPI000496E19E|nr:coiled-coil domain-containing protein 169 [Cynoglossus semilaevis]XP_008331083.1 coiled-coil domain-containing protein 169 [Cynoglossus semilaevis]
MSAQSEYSKYDLTRLRAELDQEREMREMLDESVSDLRSTMCELQDRLHSVDGEGSEWKTRYETQVELNGQLDRQISLINERLGDLRGNPIDRLASIRSYDDMPVETLRQRLKLLSEEKSDLQNQLMDCLHRTEQEGKAFHKTNDERRAYLSEIAKLSSTLEAHRRHFSTQPQRAVERQPRNSRYRGWQTSSNVETHVKRGRERGEAAGRGVHVKGGATEKRNEEKSPKGSRLPSLKHYNEHSL